MDKLGSLHHLKTLTLHGNPIETVAGYRHYILSHVPQLQTLDFSGVTKADRRASEVWVQTSLPKSTLSKKKHL